MKKLLLFMSLILMGLTSTINAQDQYLGEIRFVGFNFAPKGWAKCDGQILSIAQNTALFALLGTMYGGNGQTTFGLPDMRGRSIVHVGQAPGLMSITEGQMGGVESVTLTNAQMPAHSHTVNAILSEGNKNSPEGNLLADTKTLDKEYSDSNTGYTTMKGTMIAPSGGSQPHENRSPYIGLNCIIALEGIFPSRN